MNSEFLTLFPNAEKRCAVEPYMHKGEWATHEVLPILLDMMPKADIRISSFNISDQSLRVLSVLAKEKKANTISLMLDKSLLRNKIALLHFANQVTGNVFIDSVHAKVLLVQNKSKQFGIVGSANFNQNKKIEAGFYFTNKNVFEYFKNKFDNFAENAIRYDTNR